VDEGVDGTGVDREHLSLIALPDGLEQALLEARLEGEHVQALVGRDVGLADRGAECGAGRLDQTVEVGRGFRTH
jgi:hypothetical protein